MGQCCGGVLLQQPGKEHIKKPIYADRETAVLDISEYNEGFYIRFVATVILVESVRTSSRRHIEHDGHVSAKTCKLQIRNT